jgi:hypothetical protein
MKSCLSNVGGGQTASPIICPGHIAAILCLLLFLDTSNCLSYLAYRMNYLIATRQPTSHHHERHDLLSNHCLWRHLASPSLHILLCGLNPSSSDDDMPLKYIMAIQVTPTRIPFHHHTHTTSHTVCDSKCGLCTYCSLYSREKRFPFFLSLFPYAVVHLSLHCLTYTYLYVYIH